MQPVRIVVFEDKKVDDLYPITVSRPAYAISCGGYRLVDLLRLLEFPCQGVVRTHLAEMQQADFGDLQTTVAAGPQTRVFINARLVPSVSHLAAIRRLIEASDPCVVRSRGDIAIAVIPANAPATPHDLELDCLQDFFDYVGVAALPERVVNFSMFEYPHDVVRYNLEIIHENLEHILAQGDLREIRDGIFAAEGATLGEYVVSDTSEGPIILGANASIGPYCFLKGPAILGPKARVIEHAAIKDAVTIGHTTKIGGEVEASVIEGYTNKQHYGFLGHSYLGSWINLGAGTCNSDLKNTYGVVKMDYRGRKVSTDMQFVGCIMGDYAKTAINTGIFTGKTIGACSMVYGYVTTNVPSFVNYARLFGQVTELTPDVMVSTQERMFFRRDVKQRPCDVHLLHTMYELTRHERQLAGEPLIL